MWLTTIWWTFWCGKKKPYICSSLCWKEIMPNSNRNTSTVITTARKTLTLLTELNGQLFDINFYWLNLFISIIIAALVGDGLAGGNEEIPKEIPSPIVTTKHWGRVGKGITSGLVVTPVDVNVCVTHGLPRSCRKNPWICQSQCYCS